MIIEAETDFGWPNEPSSGTMRIYIGHVIVSEKYICTITERRKAKLIDNVKNNEIIRKETKLLVGFFADIKDMWINFSQR